MTLTPEEFVRAAITYPGLITDMAEELNVKEIWVEMSNGKSWNLTHLIDQAQLLEADNREGLIAHLHNLYLTK